MASFIKKILSVLVVLIVLSGCGSNELQITSKDNNLFNDEFMFRVKSKVLSLSDENKQKIFKSKAIIVFPEIKKFSFAYGVESGSGVMFRIIDNKLSKPIFVELTSGSIGYSIGYSSRTDILYIYNDKYVDNILDSGVVESDFSASTAGGTSGGSVGDSTTDFEIISINNGGLLFAADFKTYSIMPDDVKNSSFYGLSNISYVNYGEISKLYLEDKYQFINNENFKKSYAQNTLYTQSVKKDSSLVEQLNQYPQAMLDKSKWLVVIGIEEYEYSDNIKYSKKSAELFTKTIQKVFGVPNENTLSLIDNDATMGKIKIKLKKLLRRVQSGDSIYFYYNGHGIPVVSEENEPYILPNDIEPDYIKDDSFFKLINIYKTLSDTKAYKVVAFIDSCFTGSTDGKSIVKGVAASRLVPKKVSFNENKMVVLTAGNDKQYSNMYIEKENRLFTYFVMKSLLDGRKDIRTLYNEIYVKVKDESYKLGDNKLQEPTIEGNINLVF